MKNKLLATMLLLSLLLGNPGQASAETGSGSTITESRITEKDAFIDIGANEATVTFGELGFQETSLVSPFDSTRVLFSLPANWRLSPGGEVQLEYEVTLTGADVDLVGTNQNPYGGSLVISFNNELVDTIPLDGLGPQTVQLTLPPAAVETRRQDGRHELVIALSAQSSCIYNIRAVVVVRPTSSLRLPFEVSSPDLNLSRLPAPFYLRNALLPDRTLVVVPDEPDVQELQAALNVMSGFGSLVGDVFDFGLVTAGELTEAALAESNLVFVGRPEQFDVLSNVPFPLALENNTFTNLPPESAEDGILEMAISPWNESKAVLLVSGTSTEAVTKAAQAVSSGRVLVYENPAVSYVSSVQMLSESLPVVQDFTLQSLGYQTETLSGIGVDSVQYSFNASKEQLNSRDGTIDLMYNHSGLVDYGLSSFTVELNNQPIASTAFSKESEQLTTLQIKIPPGLLRYGENRLQVSARMFATTSCDSTGFSDPWLAISDQSSIHLPATATETTAPWLMDLKFYPDLFTTYSDLGDVAFVLPRANPSTWKVAAQLAYQLGDAATPLISNLQAVYADDVPQAVLDENSLIVIGRASAVPFISEVNAQLPAPFDLETDTASESNMQVVYRIPSGMSVGYLELINSPYNPEKTILVLAGNTDDGLIMAGNALLQSTLRSQLTGVFAVTNGTQIATGSASSTFSAVGTLVPPQDAVVATPLPATTNVASPLAAPGWLIPVLIGSGIAILLIIVLVIISAFARNREPAAQSLANMTNGNNGHSHPHPEEDEHTR